MLHSITLCEPQLSYLWKSTGSIIAQVKRVKSEWSTVLQPLHLGMFSLTQVFLDKCLRETSFKLCYFPYYF